ncbi:MAG: hypothetical protein EOO14_02785 [Chitinophagaceae bacterium]|nr:MAG: hypothetical protein EOO14_02785 [Chitinophagaceae bacterium]
MNRKTQTYSTTHIFSSIFMLLALVWLTVCLPYVNESRQLLQQIENLGVENPEVDTSNPLANTNEERAEGGNSMLSEYLHSPYTIEHNFITLSSYYKCHPADLYHAYHPDMLIPPPEQKG